MLTLLLVLTSFSALSVFAEGKEAASPAESSEESSDEAASSDESSEESSEESSVESSSSDESSEESSEPPLSFSSSERSETYAQNISDDKTGIFIELSQPNEKLVMASRVITPENTECAEIYEKLLDASKDRALVCCYEVELAGDESFRSKVTVMIPVEKNIIGRDMVVLFYPEDASRVETRNKNVTKAMSDDKHAAEKGIIKLSETLQTGKRYYFAVCEFADFVPAPGGLGIIEIMAIIVFYMAVVSGGLLAILWVRYDKKQAEKPTQKK